MPHANPHQKSADTDQVLCLLSELSALLLSWSWEGVVGYEEMVKLTARAYGYDNVFVNFEAQAATLQLDGQVALVKAEMPGFPALASTQDLKSLLADVYDGKLSIAEARASIRELGRRKPLYSPLLVWLGVIIMSAAFALDIVGTWEGILYAAIPAMATGLCFIAADKLQGFGKIAPLVATFVSGTIVMVAWKLGWTSASPGLLLIASTFAFIPGDSISMQAYELSEGRWSAAVDRFFYSVFVLVLLVAGAYFAIVVTHTPAAELVPGTTHPRFPWWVVYPGHLVLLVGIMLSFQMYRRNLLQALLVLWLATAVAQGMSIIWGEVFGTLIASMIAMVVSLRLAKKPKSIPTFVLMVPVVFTLSPGSHGLRQLESWMSGNTITGVTDLSSLVGILLAIALGMMLGRAISGWDWLHNWSR